MRTLFCPIISWTFISDKPQFPADVIPGDDGKLKSYAVEEGKSIAIDLSAKANPAEVEYKWTNPDRVNIPSSSDALSDARLVATAGVLNVTGARREDAGKYKVKASNAEGKTVAKIRLDVQYAPR